MLPNILTLRIFLPTQQFSGKNSLNKRNSKDENFSEWVSKCTFNKIKIGSYLEHTIVDIEGTCKPCILQNLTHTGHYSLTVCSPIDATSQINAPPCSSPLQILGIQKKMHFSTSSIEILLTGNENKTKHGSFEQEGLTVYKNIRYKFILSSDLRPCF